MKETRQMSEKKALRLKALTERYYGKRAILATYEEREIDDPDYIRDLKRRLLGHRNDIIYRQGMLDE